MIFWQLFYAFFKIGLFGFGGGYAMLSLIQHEVVEVHPWISNAEFTDIVAISQMTPGPIAINSATYIGYTAVHNMGFSAQASVWGSVLATFAVSLPAFIIMLIITRFYLVIHKNKHVGDIMLGLRPMVIGMILAAALILMTPANFIDYYSIALFILCLIGSLRKVNPILLIVLSGIAGYLIY